MKGLCYLLIAFILLIGYVQYESRDSMVVMQAKNVAIGAAWRVKYDKPRCEIIHRNGITLKVCG